MGKLVHCEETLLDGFPQKCMATGPLSAVEVWREPLLSAFPLGRVEAAQLEDDLLASNASAQKTGWETVAGLEAQQRQALQKIVSKGVFWKHPTKALWGVFTLHHGGEVEADGNCLFTASKRAMCLQLSPQGIRTRTVHRFINDYNAAISSQLAINSMIRNLYCPDLATGWGVHVVQEIKLLAKKAEREALDTAIEQLVLLGMIRETAAETIYNERCIPINDGHSWAKYMSLTGSPEEEYDIITLQYTQEGLLSVDENREGRAAAFGDDIAIESLATEFEREIFVVQAHGADAMVSEENCVFFLPHRPRGEIQHSPVFLFMKGTGWCGAGADHYEPLIAHPAPPILQEKAAIVL
eukprot:c26853_g1_i1 orf=597-1658(-)